jgi:cell division septation protein DedD
VGVLSAVFLMNTVSYLVPTPAPEPQPAAPPPTVTTPPPAKPMPFTLQVAAYLKPEHAEHYLEKLRQQGLDAYVIQAHGDEKTWYQVRIAHFPDKQTARTFGIELKGKGIIEDFYVARKPSP